MEDKISFGITFDDVLLEPRETNVLRSHASVATRISKNFTLDTPLIAAASDTVSDVTFAIALGKAGGLAVLHRNCSLEEHVAMVREVKASGVITAAAVGPTDVERALALNDAGADIISIDCAHAHAPGIREAAKKMKAGIRGDLIVGNIATKEAARYFIGVADAFKVGIGAGSICTTRIVSGVGVPQLTAIMNVASIASKKGIPVIADGGIRASGDIVKALAAGASSVMLGSLLSGCNESPGELIVHEGNSYKTYRGMGSPEALVKRHATDRYTQQLGNHTAEGVSGMVLSKGPVEEVVQHLVGGIKSGMGYVGAKTICDIKKRGRFIRITSASLSESHPHSLFKLPLQEK